MRTPNFDYAFALTSEKINQILRENLAEVAMEVSCIETDSLTGFRVCLQGTLQPWSIVPGGADKLLRFKIPFAQGSCLEVKGSGKPSYDLAGVSVVIETRLGWLGGGTIAAEGQGDKTCLVGDFRASTPGRSAVSVVKVLDGGGHLDLVAVSLLGLLLPRALRQSDGLPPFLLARVDPKPPGLPDGLAPKRWEYCYQENAEGGLLCILAMLDKTPLPSEPEPGLQTLARTADDQQLLVSGQAWRKKVVRPALRKVLAGCFRGGAGNSCGLEAGAVISSSFALQIGDQGCGAKSRGRELEGGSELFALSRLRGSCYLWQARFSCRLRFARQRRPGCFSRGGPALVAGQGNAARPLLLTMTGRLEAAGSLEEVAGVAETLAGRLQTATLAAINNAIDKTLGEFVARLAGVVAWTGNDRRSRSPQAGTSFPFASASPVFPAGYSTSPPLLKLNVPSSTG